MSRADAWVELVCNTTSPNAFNPYTDSCHVHDVAGAPSIRRETLAKLVAAAVSASPIDAIWLGRDLGYRGGRRTGLALTDDFHVEPHLRRWNVDDARLPTAAALVKERTASVVWEMLERIARPVFLWNVFPLHPHEPDDPFTNRTHNARERLAGEQILRELIDLLAPARIVAIGNDAARAACRVAGDRKVVEVRHPSYGGIADFRTGIQAAYGLPAISR